MTKILAISDIHGDSGLAKKAAKLAKKENVDIILIPGDLTWLEQPTKNIIEPFHKLGKKILLIPGNHETIPTIQSFSQKYPNTKNIHGNSFILNNIGFFGAGYDSKVGPFWIDDEEIFKTLRKSHEKIKDAKKKIMITHTTHEGGKADNLGFSGSEAITKAIKEFKPDFLISGHIHEAGGLYEKLGKTKIINVARKATIFEV